MNYNAIGVVYHDVQKTWLVEKYIHPGPGYDLVRTTSSQDRAQSAAESQATGNTIGVYYEQSNHFPIKFNANLPLLAEVLARHGETFSGQWIVVTRSMGSWMVWEAEKNSMANHKPALSSIDGFDKKTDAVDHAKTIVVTENRPGVLIYKANDEPQKVKIWGSRFWSSLGDRLRGNLKSGQARAFRDAAEQL